MNPTLYDILGVRPDAAPDEIKRAWRDAADRFEPGAGSSGAQFRLFNEAAEVLLDPVRRKEYDARLAAERGAGDVEEPAEPAEAEAAPAGVSLTKEKGTRDGADDGDAPQPPAPAAPPSGDTSAGAAPSGAGPSTLLLAGLGGLALVLVAVAAWLGLVTWSLPDVRAQDAVDEATRSAPATAERAAATILSYDYTSLDSDEKAAERYMTGAYAKKYADTFDKLVKGHAEPQHAKVEAQVRASGVTHADANRANVLLFVNQTSTSTANSGEPQQALNRVELSMVREGGTWKVNDITSY